MCVEEEETEDKAIKCAVLKAPVVAAARRSWARRMLSEHARQPVRHAADLLPRILQDSSVSLFKCFLLRLPVDGAAMEPPSRAPAAARQARASETG